MLKGLAIALLFFAGYGVTYLVYGKEGMALRKRQGKNNTTLSFLFACLGSFWGMSLFFWVSGMSRGDTALCITVTFVVPVLLLLFALYTRKRVKIALEEEANSNKDSQGS